MEKNKVPVNYEYYDDEIDLKELLAIIIREKKIVFLTFIIVFLCSLGGALYERASSKKASVILHIENLKRYGKIDFLSNSVLEKVYKDNEIKKEEISLDKFKNSFKIEGIIPKDVKLKQETLEKKGEIFKYTPTDYLVQVRVGDAKRSSKILSDYIDELNKELEYKYESRYRFKEMDLAMLDDNRYDYQDYLDILSERKKVLKDNILNSANNNTDYISYGFGYVDALNAILNMENIDIRELQNYLDSTKIARNVEKFRDSYSARRESLKNELILQTNLKNDQKKILDSLNIQKNEVVVPQGVKVEIGDSAQEAYYTKMMREYLAIEDRIEKLNSKLEKLELRDKGLRSPNEKERSYITNSLKNIFREYNRIVDLVNSLENQENIIKYSEIAEMATPVVTISDSKAKLILAVGVVMGVFLGIMMAFVKNFFKDFKKYTMVISLFFIIGTMSYSKEEVKIVFTHKEISEGKNPDKTPFRLDKFLRQFTMDKKSNIYIYPQIDLDSYKNVETTLENGKNIKYIPTEYLVVIEGKDEKEIAKRIKEEFPKFYIDNFFKGDRYALKLEKKTNYRQRLKELKIRMDSIENYMRNRATQEELTKEKESEYRNIQLEIWRIENTEYRDLETYINSKKYVKDIEMEKILLNGERETLLKELKNKEEKVKFYTEILKNYSKDETNRATILKNGDIALTNSSGLREKQYIELTNNYLKTLNEINEINKKLLENESLNKNMNVPTKEAQIKIEKEFEVLEKEIDEISRNMKRIELRDYKKEYQNSVKID